MIDYGRADIFCVITNVFTVTGVASTTVGLSVGGAIFLTVVLLFCAFGTGMVTVYVLRLRKKRNQSTNIILTIIMCIIIVIVSITTITTT